MSIEASLARPPFNLTPDDIKWVRKTRDGLSTKAKIQQLFVHLSLGFNEDEVIAAQPAGFMAVESRDLEKTWNTNHAFLSRSEVPPLLAQDMEGGGNHRSVITDMPNQLAFAAVADLTTCEAALDVMAREAASLGFCWSFTPCVDINAAFRSAIVGTRSYGSNIETISRHARLHMEVLRRHGIATAAKHWPGEGFDDRDQHLVTTINLQTTDEWMASFGRLYGELIQGGILSVMSAHIALPHYMARHGVPDSLERYRPTSLSRLLTHTLLREEMGFNGLVVSDATPMSGLTGWATRAEQVPGVIAAGSDIFLFSTHVQSDYQHMEHGLQTGLLSEQRLEEAVTRVLGFKAALGLHRKSIADRLEPLDELRGFLNAPAHRKAARAVADAAVTLVKDTKSILPLDPQRHRRITWIGKPAPGFLPGMPDTPLSDLRDGLEAAGFVVSSFDPRNPPTPENTDLVLYALPVESSLGKSRIYIDWLTEQPGMQNIMSRYWNDIPTIMVSFGHPYHLYDAPRVPCYINAHSPTADSQAAVLERLLGNVPFEGVSPVDPFAGAPDARY